MHMPTKPPTDGRRAAATSPDAVADRRRFLLEDQDANAKRRCPICRSIWVPRAVCHTDICHGCREAAGELALAVLAPPTAFDVWVAEQEASDRPRRGLASVRSRLAADGIYDMLHPRAEAAPRPRRPRCVRKLQLRRADPASEPLIAIPDTYTALERQHGERITQRVRSLRRVTDGSEQDLQQLTRERLIAGRLIEHSRQRLGLSILNAAALNTIEVCQVLGVSLPQWYGARRRRVPLPQPVNLHELPGGKANHRKARYELAEVLQLALTQSCWRRLGRAIDDQGRVIAPTRPEGTYALPPAACVPADCFRGYLSRTVTNIVRNHRRSMYRRHKERPLGWRRADEAPLAVEEIPGTCPDPERDDLVKRALSVFANCQNAVDNDTLVKRLSEPGATVPSVVRALGLPKAILRDLRALVAV